MLVGRKAAAQDYVLAEGRSNSAWVPITLIYKPLYKTLEFALQVITVHRETGFPATQGVFPANTAVVRPTPGACTPYL